MHSPLCIRVTNLSNTLCNLPGKEALYAGKRSVVIRHSIPEILWGTDRHTYTQSKYVNTIKPVCTSTSIVIEFSSILSSLMCFFAWVGLGRLDRGPGNPFPVGGLKGIDLGQGSISNRQGFLCMTP